jgi:hypothetical protein
MSVIQQTGKTLEYAMPWNWDEVYESGYNKGENRFLENFQKQIPIWKQIERMSPDGIKGQLQFNNLN